MMSNELLLIIELLTVYGTVLLFYRYGGRAGLIAFMVIATILANIEVLMLVEAFGMVQTLGNILFAATFLITDILSEKHGKKAAQKAVNIGIATSAAFILISWLWIYFTPAASDWATPHIKEIFSYTPRVVAASLIAYAICQKLDVWLYHRIWAASSRSGDKSKYLWLRNNGATLIAQLINTVLFNLLAFYGLYSSSELLSIMGMGYIIFIFTSLADTPFLYLARKISPKNEDIA